MKTTSYVLEIHKQLLQNKVSNKSTADSADLRQGKSRPDTQSVFGVRIGFRIQILP